MSLSPPLPQHFSQQLSRLSEESLALACEVEAGQAETPFSDRLKRLAQPAGEAEPVRVVVLGLEPESTHAALGFFLGQEYNLYKVAVPSRLGYSEIALNDRAFVFDAGGEACEFTSADAFVQALQESRVMEDPHHPRWMDPLRLQMKAARQLSGLHLLVPNRLQSLVENPALLSTLSDRADWLLLVGRENSQFDATSRQVVQLLLDNILGVQCLLAEGKSLPAKTPAWASDWRATLSLGLVALGSTAVEQRLALLLRHDSELRQLALEMRRYEHCKSEVELLAEEIGEQGRRTRSRSRLVREGLHAEGTAGASLRKTVDAARQRMVDGLEALRQRQDQALRQALSPEGELFQSLQQEAEALDASDLRQEEQGAAIRLSLAEETRQHLKDKLTELGRARLEADASELEETLEQLRTGVAAELQALLGELRPLSLESLVREDLWNALRAAIHPEIRYKGEMARPTLMSRFQAARQGIMGMMIVGMILGGVGTLLGGQAGGGGIRTILYALMLPLLLVGFIWTYVSFSRKEAEALSREAEKLRESVFSELRRVTAEVVRQEQAILQQHAQKVMRELQQQMVRQLDEVELIRNRELEDARRKQQEQSRSAELRLRRLSLFEQRARALADKLGKLSETRRQWLLDWIRRFNAGSLPELR